MNPSKDILEGATLAGGPEPLTDEQIQSTLDGYYSAAEGYIDEIIGPVRAESTRFYRGEPFGNEEDGRSKVISSDVRDTISGLMPSLMKVFFGPDRVLEFRPRTPADVPLAEQMTDYVEYVVREDNAGFLILWDWFKDALTRKVGIVKSWWDERQEVSETTLTGLTEETLALAQQEVALDQNARLDIEAAEDGTISAKVVRSGKVGMAKFRVVPPDEFLIHPESTLSDRPRYCAHRTMMTVGELVSMGYNYDTLIEHSEMGRTYASFGEERDDRNERTGAREWGLAGDDGASRPVLYVEHYVEIDTDGDGISELRKICTIGPSHVILSNEVVDELPFSVICPDPEPHEYFGLCPADVTKDVQLVKSTILRGILDSLAQSIVPRYGAVEGQVNMADLLNNEVGGVIRMRAPGMAQPFMTPFVGKDAFPILSYYDELKENRTGVSKAAAGLNPDALQSSTKAAVAATVSGAQQHVEIIARIFAESGLKHLYKRLLRLVVQNQQKPRMVRMKDQWTEVSPAGWNTNFDLQVNVGVGEATVEARIETLLGLAQKIELFFEKLGPMNPLARPSNYRALLAKVLELSGFKDVDRYLLPPNPEAEARAAQKAQQSNADAQAAQMLAQVQVEQIKADIAMKQADLELKRGELAMKRELEMEKLAQDERLKIAQMEMQYKQAIEVAQIQRRMAAENGRQNAGQD